MKRYRGIWIPFNSSNPAVSDQKNDECENLGFYLKSLRKDLKPVIFTRKSLENALRLIAAGGSTAAFFGYGKSSPSLSIDDFQKISDST